MPLVDIHTIGAGGGSLAWLEAGGLRVGPQSAGADPGPACYGRGGTQPTVTDANLFLGRLDPSYFLGGADDARRRRGRAGAARRSRPRSASTTTALAEGMLAIVNANMADAMRTITVKQGIDPREFALVAFGGAGPMHAVWLAEELEIGEVIVPWSPGTFSAWGMLQTDIRHDVVRSFYRPLAELDAERGRRGVRRAAATRPTRCSSARTSAPADRYFAALGRHALRRPGVHGQRAGRPRRARLEAIDASFHEAHRVRYGHSTPGRAGRVRQPPPRRRSAGSRTTVTPHGAAGGRLDPLLGRRDGRLRRRRARHAGAPARPAARRRATTTGRLVIEEAELDHRRPARATRARSTSTATC